MLLEIRHQTQYVYNATVRESIMELWQQPQKTGTQRLVSFHLEIDPPAHVFSYTDNWGNAVYHFDVPQPHEHLTIQAVSAVETSPGPELPEALDMGEWSRLDSDFVRGECYDFLSNRGLTEESELLEKFIAKHKLDALKSKDPLTAVMDLSKVIHDALEYEPGATEPDSHIDDPLKLGQAVCQDYAHIMIAICRMWGVPARYVSGYLYSGRHDKDRSRPDAGHAWVEVFLPSLRWVGIDPTNDIPAGERHVAVAVGRDYNDCPPSSGFYKGEGDSQLYVAVSVTPAKQAAIEPELMLRPKKSMIKEKKKAREGDAPYREFQQQQQQQ